MQGCYGINWWEHLGKRQRKTMLLVNLSSFCIIGEDTLLTKCADTLLQRGHTIVGVIAQNHFIEKWAKEAGIPLFESISAFQQYRSDWVFDYFLSIANGKIIQEDILRLPKKLAINYHYSLLPSYAGTYATSWAILNGEKSHGVTWHVMTKEIDGGDILKQAHFRIDKHETAITLNLKCYSYAIKTFDELVEDLEHNRYTLTKQNPLQRHYSTLKKRPPRNGLIAWDESAQEIDRLCRALTFGNYLNQLGLPKLTIGSKVYTIQALRTLEEHAIAAPGTVVGISDEALHIATSTLNVAIDQLVTSDGLPCTLSDFVERHNIKIGYQFSSPTPERINELDKAYARCIKHESYWVGKIQEILPGKLKFFVSSELGSGSKKIITTQVSEVLYIRFNKHRNETIERKNILITVIFLYLYRLNNCDNFTSDVSWPELYASHANVAQYFSTQVPLTLDFSPEIVFEKALVSVLKTLDELSKHQTYARDIKLRYPKELSHVKHLNLITVAIVEDIHTYQPNNAALNLAIASDGSAFAILADSLLFPKDISPALFEAMPDHILNLMTAILKYPERGIAHLEILTTSERQMILHDWNHTTVPNLRNVMVHQLFEEQSLRTPNHTAVTFQDQRLSFSILNERANQLAHYLQQSSIIPDTPIAICAKRGLEMVVGILAILKAGGAYVPLDPHYPIDRLQFILENSQAEILILSHTDLSNRFENYRGRIVDLEQDQVEITRQSKNNPPYTTTPRNLAYVIYTSGTTGKPKGVAIEHRSLVNHMLWMIPKFHFSEQDIFLQKTSFSFDASVWEFFAPLICGGQLAIASSHEPTDIIDAVLKYKVTILQLVPSLFRQILNEPTFVSCETLQQVFSGGEALSLSTVNLFFTKMTAKLHNLYGPTETTIQVITHSFDSHRIQPDGPSLLGTPINNTQVYVLDKNLNLVPIGIEGELYIGGLCLARGYLNQPELTANRFIHNPFGLKASDIFYKTGDRVRWLPNGHLEYLGRFDTQIKLNGFRIELGEIESTLLQHGSIRECAVVVQGHLNDEGSENRHLVAYYVKKSASHQAAAKNFVKEWNSVFQSTYSVSDTPDFKKNITGWISSYTNKPLETAEMLEWIQMTTDRIKQLQPKTILEIGSGNGLILFNIVDSCDYYYATDFSSNVINHTNNIVHKYGYSEKVSTIAATADDIPYPMLKKSYDTVIINSVIQYFPSLAYLEDVIIQAIANMKDGGQLFIGDIRDFRLLKCFHYSVKSYNQEELSKERIDYFSLRDKELLVSPEYFILLMKKYPDIANIELLPKLGNFDNEMNNYRYDAILHIRKNKMQEQKTETLGLCISESEFIKVLDFENTITLNQQADFTFIKYPNKRIIKDYIACNRLYNDTLGLTSEDYQNILNMHQITKFVKTQNKSVKFFLNSFDPFYLNIVIFNPTACTDETIFIDYPLKKSNPELASKPLQTVKLLETQFSNELKEFLHSKLPKHMVPGRYVPLEKLPLSANGKIDTNALAEIEFTKSERYTPPNTPVESQLCKIFADVLGLPEDKVGTQDDFFSLGGHSLSALRALSLLKNSFSINLTTRIIFDYPTVEKLSNLIIKLQTPGSPESKLLRKHSMMISPIVVLQKQGFDAPLFLIHPLGGTLFWYNALAKHLTKNRPIYGIEDPGVSAHEFIFNDLPEMATYYLKAMREIQPSGPYLLGGASFGGIVAIEIANQFMKMGETINFVGLLDAWPTYPEKFWDKAFLDKLMLGQYQDTNIPLNQRIGKAFLLTLYQHRALMLRDYKIPILNTGLTFFQATEPWPAFKGMKGLPADCWQPYSTQPVAVHPLPSNHESMFWEPHVQILAKKMNLALKKSTFAHTQLESA